MHKIFKGIVPHTDRKNVELGLLKKYTTLFAIRHLIDGGIDPRLSQSSKAFADLSKNLIRIMSDWFIVEEQTDNNNDNELEGCKIFHYLFIVIILYLLNFY